MTQYTTLSQFVEEQLTRFEIPDTEKNQNKLRIKFTRELKKLGMWDSAKTKLIGRKHTKVFTPQNFQILYNGVEPYLLKLSNIDTEKLKEHRHKLEEWLDELATPTDYYDYNQQQYKPPTVTQTEVIEVMITAIFEKFFEPLNIEQWNNDKATIFYTDDIDADSIDYFKSSERLKNPVASYTKEKMI